MFSRDNIDKLFAIAPEIQAILCENDDNSSTRQQLLNYFNMVLEASVESTHMTGLQYALKKSCIKALRQMLSQRSSALIGNDFLTLLKNLAQGNIAQLPDDLSDYFFTDLMQIYLGAFGKPDIYGPLASTQNKGRAAGIERSDDLDKLCDWRNKFEYACGLAPEIIQKRSANKRRVMSFFDCCEEDFSDYNWQLKHVIKDPKTLAAIIPLTDSEFKAVYKANQLGIPFGITPYYATLFDSDTNSNEDMPVRRQVIPPLEYVETMEAAKASGNSSLDFMRESDTSPIDLITRRYPGIVILKPYNTCAQICVYCQRNWEIKNTGAPQAKAPNAKIDEAIKWIADNNNISDVLVTGGDPVVMQDHHIERVLKGLTKIKSVERIRLGTRTPVVLPQRFTDSLLEIISKYNIIGEREIVVVTHFEHTYEITPEAREAVRKLRNSGITVYNQAVFTIQNSRRFELSALRKTLRKIGVEPYYTFNAKGKKGTDFYRVPVARLQQEIMEEARLLPGLTRTDEAVYNVPGLGKNYLRGEQNHVFLGILPDGRRVYEFHPWEKLVNHSPSFVHKDVPIGQYLDKISALGENPEDYKTIYYYF